MRAMAGVFSRRVFLAGLSASVALPAVVGSAQAGGLTISRRPVLRDKDLYKRAVPSADSIVAEARLGGKVCYAVADARTGALLEGGRAQEALPPASVAKALTALYALETLGPGHRFKTRLLAAGAVRNGILEGDLILQGGADPTLDTDQLGALVKQLKDTGVREVRGAFKVAHGMLPDIRSIDPTQPAQVAYSPAVSGIALNFNRVHFEWRRGSNGYAVTMEARARRYSPAVAVTKMRIENRRAPVYTYEESARREDWSVARSALGRSGARWLPVRKPALYAGDVFQTVARSHGIVLKAPKLVRSVGTGATVLAEVQSAPLTDVLQAMLKFSNNLTAEMVGLAATVKRKGRATGLTASAREMSQWAEARFGTKGIGMRDHSGLTDKSRMTPAAMVGTLSRAYGADALRPILKPVSVRDTQTPLDVRAKTGTLNFVSGLAGYIQPAQGRDLVFAIFAADQATRAQINKANRESPQGAKSWNRRAKTMQQRMLARWGLIYGT